MLVFYLERWCWCCAFVLWNILTRRHSESSHNAIWVSTERRRLAKRIETVPPSHFLSKQVRLESSPANRHFAVNYARHIASKRAILCVTVCRLSAVSCCLRCDVKAHVVFFTAVTFRDRATLIVGILFNGYRGLFPQRLNDRSVKLTTYFHLFQRYKNEWAITLPSVCINQLSKKNCVPLLYR